MNRDVFNWIRLLRSPSNLALNVPGDGYLLPLWATFPVFHHPHHKKKKIFLLSSLNLPSFDLKLFPLSCHKPWRQTERFALLRIRCSTTSSGISQGTVLLEVLNSVYVFVSRDQFKSEIKKRELHIEQRCQQWLPQLSTLSHHSLMQT